jgi:[glutamine synthetase] adenylyltransferase / [glutamine synthetase]-adenylyl-L-tyrosine phosphorylase
MKPSPKHISQKQARGKRVNRSGVPDPTPVLLASDLASAEVARLLQAYGIQDWKRADHNLQTMAGDPNSRKALAGILHRLLSGLSQTADPDQALNEWERYVDSGIHRLQLFQYLQQVPHVIDVLGAAFGNSQAMAQTLIRDPLLVYWIEEDGILVQRRTRSNLVGAVQAALEGVKNYEAKCEALRRLKRREMLRLGIRDLLGIATPIETYTVLSDLAAEVIQAAYELVDQELQREHGGWRAPTSMQGKDRIGFSVLAMGKLGGWELNYSSDVDLIYVYQAPQASTNAGKGQQPILGSDYFHLLARELTNILSASTSEGALFRVDMRLRPEGDVGPLACSVEDACHYYQIRGRTWERLAFLKAKPIAGDVRIGQSLIKKLEKFVYGTRETAAQVFTAIHALRSQMVSKMSRRGELERNVKLGIGGIREIEFIVQSLQLRWGYRYPSIRDRQTLKSLTKLTRVGKLKIDALHQLKESYVFFRNLESKIQMVHELQTHLLPSKTQEVAKCAMRMGYPRGETEKQTAEYLLADYRGHTQKVHKLYQQIVNTAQAG